MEFPVLIPRSPPQKGHIWSDTRKNARVTRIISEPERVDVSSAPEAWRNNLLGYIGLLSIQGAYRATLSRGTERTCLVVEDGCNAQEPYVIFQRVEAKR